MHTKKIVERAKELKAHGMEQEMLREYYETKLKQDGVSKYAMSEWLKSCYICGFVYLLILFHSVRKFT